MNHESVFYTHTHTKKNNTHTYTAQTEFHQSFCQILKTFSKKQVKKIWNEQWVKVTHVVTLPFTVAGSKSIPYNKDFCCLNLVCYSS